MKIKSQLITISSIFLMLLLLGSVQAATDGITGSSEGSVYLKGQVTKDVTNINSLFDGITGSNTYTLTDNSTNLTNMRLLSGEYTDAAGTDMYGNITANPAEITHGDYNSSGYLRLPVTSATDGRFTETDTGSLMSITKGTAGAKTNAPDALHVLYSTTGSSLSAKLTMNLPVSVNLDNYIIIGAIINTDSLNITAQKLQFRLFDGRDASGTGMEILGYEGASDATPVGSGLRYDIDTGDVFMFQFRLSTLAATLSSSISAISSVQILINGGNSAIEGTLNFDLFAFDFLTTPAKFGQDRNDQVSAASDYVALNVTNPSSADLKVRELDPKITHVNDATIDFVADVSSQDTYDPDNYRVTKDYTFKLGTPSTWQDDVTFSNLAVYHILEADYTDYTSYSFESTDLSTSILNEEPGDVIVASSSISEDVEYTLKYQVQYTQAAYDALIASESMSWTDWMQYAFWAVLAFVVPISFFKDKKETSKRRGKTRAANRK